MIFYARCKKIRTPMHPPPVLHAATPVLYAATPVAAVIIYSMATTVLIVSPACSQLG